MSEWVAHTARFIHYIDTDRPIPTFARRRSSYLEIFRSTGCRRDHPKTEGNFPSVRPATGRDGGVPFLGALVRSHSRLLSSSPVAAGRHVRALGGRPAAARDDYVIVMLRTAGWAAVTSQPGPASSRDMTTSDLCDHCCRHVYVPYFTFGYSSCLRLSCAGPNARPRLNQRSRKPLRGCCKPKKI